MNRRPQSAQWGLVALATLACGCFGPSVPSGLSCAESMICPQGQLCDPSDLVCRPDRSLNSDASTDGSQVDSDGGTIDAPFDDGFCADDDVVLCLRFEERPADDSGGMLAVSEVAPIAYINDGIRGKGGSFDGDGYLQIDDMIGGDPHTVELWLRLDALGTFIAVEGSYRIRQISPSTVEWNNGLLGILRATLQGSDWAHLALVVGSVGVSMYVNGNSVMTVPFVTGSGVPNMTIGSNFGNDAWAGEIDQMRVWKRALSAGEVADIFDDR